MRRDSRAASADFEDLPADVAYDHALDKALKLLSVRSRSRAEIVSRLRRIGFSGEVVSMVEARLCELDILNDHNYAQESVERSIARGLAPKLILYELQAKGVAVEVAKSAIARVQTPEGDRERALELARRRSRAYGRLDPAAAQRRLAGFLAHKGYSSDLVYSVCVEVLGEADID